MGVLLLRLSGPLQAWGDASRFTSRVTRREPTKSGVVGMLASALGRERGASVADLAVLELGVRADQPGKVIRDFQTERSLDEKVTLPLTNRYYLSDAKFLVALGGDDALLSRAAEAIAHPRWPLYLGRRSCPPDSPILLGVPLDRYADVRDALREAPWQAADWYRRKGAPELEVTCDARDGESCESRMDLPLSFGDERLYAGRPVTRFRVPNPDGKRGDGTSSEATMASQDASLLADLQASHDPMGFI